jgi:hypothetical protein
MASEKQLILATCQTTNGEIFMKRFTILIATIILAWTSVHAAGDTYSNDPRFTDEKLQAIEQSLQQALENGGSGLQASAAQVVRDVKALVPRYEFSCLVIPLMRIVKDESAQPASRILAALALHELESERGDFAIKRVGEFTAARQVKRVCVSLTHERMGANVRQKDSPAILASRVR